MKAGIAQIIAAPGHLTKIASRQFFLPQTRVSQRISTVGIFFARFNRRENRRSLAILDPEEIAVLVAEKSHLNLWGSVESLPQPR